VAHHQRATTAALTAADRIGCPFSPRCRPPALVLADLGLPPSTSIVWLHLGPFGRTSTIVARHGTNPRACRVSTLPTWPEHRGHLGYRLDLFCIAGPPSSPSYRRLIVAPGQMVHVRGVIAWRDPDGPFVLWRYGADGSPESIWRFPDGRVRAEDIAEAQRCEDLLAGRASRLGRPSRLDSDYWRPIAERAERMYAEHPSMGWLAIANTVGVDERTLRDYRRLLARERAAPSSVQPALILGG
jgi:hypothetical protein